MDRPTPAPSNDEVINSDADRRNKALEVLSEFMGERAHQCRKWADGTLVTLDRKDDQQYNMPADWLVWVTHYSGHWARSMLYVYDRDKTLKAFRRSMVQVGALALAAILWVDRRLPKE